MSGEMRGPKCKVCDATEQRCAFLGGVCCAGCSHWLDFDIHGNHLVNAPGRRMLPVEHGTERGYQQHRVRHELPCPDCRRAHAEYRRRVA
jgi:hypothetical protein